MDSFGYFGNSFSSWEIGESLRQTTNIDLSLSPSVANPTGFVTHLHLTDGDFMSVVVDGGLVKVLLDVGSGPGVVTHPTPISPDVFTSISIRRFGQNVEITHSGQTHTGSAPGGFTVLNVDNILYVGGLPAAFYPVLPAELAPFASGFQGCIKSVSVNGSPLQNSDVMTSQNVAVCDANACDPNPCRNGGTCTQTGASFSCRCPSGQSGPTCDGDPCASVTCNNGGQCFVLPSGDAACACPLPLGGPRCDVNVVIDSPAFDDALGSFMAFPPFGRDVRGQMTIEVNFRPDAADGLILYAARSGSTPSSDFIALGMYDGFVEFRYNLGGLTAEIKSAARVTLGETHTVTATRELRNGKENRSGK